MKVKNISYCSIWELKYRVDSKKAGAIWSCGIQLTHVLELIQGRSHSQNIRNKEEIYVHDPLYSIVFLCTRVIDIHTSYKIAENIFHYLRLFHNLIFEVLFNSQVLIVQHSSSFELCVMPNYIVEFFIFTYFSPNVVQVVVKSHFSSCFSVFAPNVHRYHILKYFQVISDSIVLIQTQVSEHSYNIPCTYWNMNVRR